MSSAFLYIGIVAIWALVLIPRWLRRDHEQSDAAADADDGLEPGLAADDEHESDLNDGDGRGSQAPSQAGEQAETPMPARSPVMQARRRLLTMLLTVTGGAVACFMLKLTPWWIIVPPAGMLGLFVLLLREATIADAERARRQSPQAAQSSQVRAARQHGAAAERRVITFEEPEPSGPSADVIDISARVSDQLYDQYADATIRAVGD